jgi:hypothetical protein
MQFWAFTLWIETILHSIFFFIEQYTLLGRILTFSGTKPNPRTRPTLVHPTKSKYYREHNPLEPVKTTWAKSVTTGPNCRPKY